MNIRDALLKAKEIDGFAILRQGSDCITAIYPFIGRMGTASGGATYDDYVRNFNSYEDATKYMVWEELISNDWIVEHHRPIEWSKPTDKF